jgi:hypothetical protein
MRTFELLVATVFGLLGVRSLIHWIRRPFDSRDPRDHVLFALFVLGRVGAWWSLAGLFLLSATLKDPNGTGAYIQGRAFADLFHDRYWWYPLVVLGFVLLQFVAGYFLGRRTPHDEVSRRP